MRKVIRTIIVWTVVQNFPFYCQMFLPSATRLYSHPYSLWKRSNILICDVKLKGSAGGEREEEEGVGRKELKYIAKLSTFKMVILTAINKVI